MVILLMSDSASKNCCFIEKYPVTPPPVVTIHGGVVSGKQKAHRFIIDGRHSWGITKTQMKMHGDCLCYMSEVLDLHFHLFS